MNEMKKFYGLTYQYDGYVGLLNLAFNLGWKCFDAQNTDDILIKFSEKDLDWAENDAIQWLENNGLKISELNIFT